MYKIEVLEDKKVVYVVTAGLMKKEEGLEVLNKLKETFKKVKTSQYYLILDSSDFKPSFQEDLGLLQEVIEQYEKTSFIKKFFILPKSTIAKIQARKADKTALPSYLIEVSSFDEAISMIK